MSSRALFAVGATLLLTACASSTTPAASPDAGNGPFCPAGPTKATASASALPSGACEPNNGPCNYEATPCPEVVNGAVFGYVCGCDAGTWSCPVVSQRGACGPLPGEDGSAGDSGFPPVPLDAAPGPGGSDAGGPAKP